MTSDISGKVPCQRCGSTEWIISMITDCDQCNPDLSMERLDKMMSCKHEHREPSRIIGTTNCLDCGMCGIELIEMIEKRHDQ